MTEVDQQPSAPDEREPDDTPQHNAPAPDAAVCDVCGSCELVWLRCKLTCAHCHTILMACGDL